MITVHVGLPKTGSTSIQARLDIASEEKKIFVAKNPLAERFLDPINATVTLRLAEKSHLILSDESILGRPSQGFELLERNMAGIRHLAERQHLQVVVYLRPQSRWLESLYLQELQQGQDVEPFEFWGEIATVQRLKWSKLATDIWDCSGNAHINFRPYRANLDVVADFFEAARIGSPPLPQESARINSSISASQAVLLRAMNKLQVPSANQSLVNRRFMQAFASVDASSPFPTSLQSEIRKKFREDWNVLTTLVSQRDSVNGQLFSNSQEEEAWDERTYVSDTDSETLIIEAVHLLSHAAGEFGDKPLDSMSMKFANAVRRRKWRVIGLGRRQVRAMWLKHIAPLRLK